MVLGVQIVILGFLETPTIACRIMVNLARLRCIRFCIIFKRFRPTFLNCPDYTTETDTIPCPNCTTQRHLWPAARRSIIPMSAAALTSLWPAPSWQPPAIRCVAQGLRRGSVAASQRGAIPQPSRSGLSGLGSVSKTLPVSFYPSRSPTTSARNRAASTNATSKYLSGHSMSGSGSGV